MTRKSKSDNERICLDCPSYCCRDLVIPTNKPKTRSEVEDLKWHLHFDTVRIFIRNHRWYILVKGRCIYLDENNLCTIYDRRPAKCRYHNPPDCERFGKYYDVMLTTPEELEQHLNGKRKMG